MIKVLCWGKKPWRSSDIISTSAEIDQQGMFSIAQVIMFLNHLEQNKSINISLPRRVVIVLLAWIFALGFILSPYWRIPLANGEIFALLALTLVIGAIWAYLSAGNVNLQIHYSPSSWISFAVLLIGMLALNAKTLIAPIPYRGDESHHMGLTLILIREMHNYWLAFLLIAFILPLLTAWRKPKWALYIGFVSLVSLILFVWLVNPLQVISGDALLQYPFVNYWFFFLAPKAATLFTTPYYPLLFRLTPFFITFLLAWIFQKRASSSDTPLNFIWGLSAATMPTVYYYSSILYLEQGAVLLMTIVCLSAKSLLTDDFRQIRQNPAWYALILIGFIKETVIAFLLCYLACRFVVSLLQKRKKDSQPFIHFLIQEMGIYVTCLAPFVLFIFLRSNYSISRDYIAQPEILLNPSIYAVIGESLFEQFGIFLLFFAGGCIWLFWKREYAQASFLISIPLMVTFFHTVDHRGVFAGYSRFNLFILAPILAASGIFLKQISQRKMAIGTLMACLAITVNLLFTPINPDGTKKPFWGNIGADTSEHYYPYPEALYWVKKNYGDERILFSGMYYEYDFNFYFDKFNWHPQHDVLYIPWDVSNDAEIFKNVMSEAEKKKYSVVVYQIRRKDVPMPREIDHYRLEKLFENQAHLLAVYRLIP